MENFNHEIQNASGMDNEHSNHEKLLDVCPVEPKYRFDFIMGAWKALRSKESFLLTVDHDPQCMYYTLVADEGEQAFCFDYLENGPEVWKVRVTKK